MNIFNKIKSWYNNLEVDYQKEKKEAIGKYYAKPIVSIGKFRCINCKHIFNMSLRKGDKPYLAVGLTGSYVGMITENPEITSGDFLECPFCKTNECKMIRNDSGEILLIEATKEELLEVLNKQGSVQNET